MDWEIVLRKKYNRCQMNVIDAMSAITKAKQLLEQLRLNR